MANGIPARPPSSPATHLPDVLPPLPWILAGFAVALLLGAGAMAWLKGRRARARLLPTEWALTARPVFNLDERRVYRQLREALPDHLVLLKLPLVRLCQPTDPQQGRYWYSLLGSAHVSFAVCSSNGRVLAAIDLASDRGTSRRAAQIKQSVLDACHVRYLRCLPERLPTIPELQLLVPPLRAAARGAPAAPFTAASAQVRDLLATTVANRRRERTTPWQESGYLQDSFFGVDGRAEFAASSSFGATRPPDDLSADSARLNGDAGGVTVNTLNRPSRH